MQHFFVCKFKYNIGSIILYTVCKGLEWFIQLYYTVV